MRWLTRIGAVILIMCSGSAVHAACPIGSFPWMDSWGNPICKSFSTGATQTITPAPGSVGGCPVGSHPWVDAWGNPVCQSF